MEPLQYDSVRMIIKAPIGSEGTEDNVMREREVMFELAVYGMVRSLPART